MAMTSNLGYPRIGKHRELKRATEGYWAGKVTAGELASTASAIRRASWQTQRESGISLIPSNDFTYYDQVLDTIALVGAVPERFDWHGGTVDLDTYFGMARGIERQGQGVKALDMTKWFDTNYHYLVPELEPGQTFRLASSKPFDEYEEARSLGIQTKPVLIGPVSFLLLGASRVDGLDPLELLDSLVPVYGQVIAELASRGAEWIQLDEPCFVQDRTDRERQALSRAYGELARSRGQARLLVQTYFDHVGDSYQALVSLPVQGIGLDFVHGRRNLDLVEAHGFPDDKILGAGLVDGRNVWATDLGATLDLVDRIGMHVASDRLLISPSCSLQHVPIDLRLEDGALDQRLLPWLAFAEQKLAEVALIGRAVAEGRRVVADRLEENARAMAERRSSEWTNRPEVRERAAAVGAEAASRGMDYEERREAQRRSLDLPLYPTTAIGSFPQTDALRRERLRLQRGEIGPEEYDRYIADGIRELIAFEEELGLDVLVHGEFERNDMVQYFGELLDGFATTRHGWVQSYGTRYVRPPIIYGDVSRPGPMTVRWSTYAQSLTSRPVKGMLTGPVTILNWSFVRDDQPESETCEQIALCLRDEVRDLEAAGLRVIQVDEPALREGLPLHREAWPAYLDWATRAYRLVTGVAKPATQIHSHMCYSQFDDIIEAIAALDADVISLSNSRSDLTLLGVFRRFAYRNEIGPGVYDVHSPRVPSAEEMRRNLAAASGVLDPAQLWVNPDCGLKTRRWEEVRPALRNLVQAARDLRRSTEAVSS